MMALVLEGLGGYQVVRDLGIILEYALSKK